MKQRGAIRADFVADIIATPNNPLEDINALKQVNFVMKDGKVFKPSN
jgi:imidazolonepropionase-like amidohydrolase